MEAGGFYRHFQSGVDKDGIDIFLLLVFNKIFHALRENIIGWGGLS